MPLPDVFSDTLPTLNLLTGDKDQPRVELLGCWNLRYLANSLTLQQKITQTATDKNAAWDLTKIEVLDSGSALILWQAWGENMPSALQINPEHTALFASWQAQTLPTIKPKLSFYGLFRHYWQQLLPSLGSHLLSLLALFGQLFLDCCHLLRHPTEIPWAEMSIAIYDAGVKALGITALVGFLIGIVLSYLSALQLKMFGAEIYIINILGLSIIRELGPLLAAILVAGRSGSSMTAQLGIMRVTEELDALSAMGISHSIRLIFPKVLALALVLPLLSVWTSFTALLGGMVAAAQTLNISTLQFATKLPDVIPLMNVFLGLGKSAVFGLAIALIACHFGFRIQPNTESLGNETTSSVVAAITVVIMIDAVFAILFMGVGMP